MRKLKVTNRLESARVLAGLDRHQLAQKTGLHPGQIVLLETGHLAPLPHELRKIGKVLGVRDLSALAG